MRTSKYLVRIAFSFLILWQTTQTTFAQSDGNGSFGMHSVGFSLGAYEPTLGNWSNSPIVWMKANSNFFFPTIFAEARVYSFIYARIEAGYNQEKVWKPITNFGDQSLNYSFIPISGALFFNVNPESNDVKFYLGGGGGTCLINRTYSYNDLVNKTSGSDKASGADVIYFLSAEVEVPMFIEFFSMSLEFRYSFGTFNQQFMFNNILNNEKVSFDGPGLGIKFKYLFGN